MAIITGITVITADGSTAAVRFLLPAAAVDAGRPAPMARAGTSSITRDANSILSANVLRVPAGYGHSNDG
jgi:hypothetical protein